MPRSSDRCITAVSKVSQRRPTICPVNMACRKGTHGVFWDPTAGRQGRNGVASLSRTTASHVVPFGSALHEQHLVCRAVGLRYTSSSSSSSCINLIGCYSHGSCSARLVVHLYNPPPPQLAITVSLSDVQGFDAGAVSEPTAPVYRAAAASAVNIPPTARTFEGLVSVSLDAPLPKPKRAGKQVRKF